MGSKITVRTKCCESYKIYGVRCSVCPNRPENQALLTEIRSAPEPQRNVATGSRFRSCFRQAEEVTELAGVLGD